MPRLLDPREEREEELSALRSEAVTAVQRWRLQKQLLRVLDACEGDGPAGDCCFYFAYQGA